MNSGKKIIVILGQTASGKSDLAVQVAKRFNGEVISADSRQVYKGMSIGTGKITKKEMAGVPHYCLDVASPKTIYTASDFKKCADKAIEKIWSKGKVPVICGGTGFYIDVLLGKMQTTEVPPNPKLRKELEKKPVDQLFKMLQKLDPERAKNIDAKNPRRLIRAIEIAKYNKDGLGSFAHLASLPASGLRRRLVGQTTQAIKLFPSVLQIGISWPEKELKERIRKRLLARLKQGMTNEVKKLHRQGVSWKRLDDFGLEYRYVSKYLQGLVTKEQMIDQLYSEICKYAKRQTTWFKRDKNIIWLKPNQLKKSEGLVKKFLTKIN